jgi:sugar/nucleoside kinase (ribokinase family)
MTAGADPGTVISHGSKPRPIVSGSKAGWVVDPVGAGDEFLATLVLEYLSEAAHGRVSHEAVHVAAERAAAWATERAMLNWRRRR